MIEKGHCSFITGPLTETAGNATFTASLNPGLPCRAIGQGKCYS